MAPHCAPLVGLMQTPAAVHDPILYTQRSPLPHGWLAEQGPPAQRSNPSNGIANHNVRIGLAYLIQSVLGIHRALVQLSLCNQARREYTLCMARLALFGLAMLACNAIPLAPPGAVSGGVGTSSGGAGGGSSSAGAASSGGTGSSSSGGGAPVFSSISVSPAALDVPLGGKQTFTATALDQFGTALLVQPSFVWSVSGGGSIDTHGAFTGANTAGGPFTVTAQSGTTSGTAKVTLKAVTADFAIELSSSEQMMDGFGAADPWLNPQSDAVMTLLFSPTNGIGLSLYRMGIDNTGAGSISDWSNVKKALALNPDIKVWGAPWDVLSVGQGNPLPTAQYATWAADLASYASTFNAQTGANLYAISVENEPDYNGNGSISYSPAQMAAFIDVLGPKLHALSPAVKLLSPETSSWGNAMANFVPAIEGDATALANTDFYAAHQYAGYAAPSSNKRHIWETEMSAIDGGFDPSIGNALTTVSWIHDALTTGMVSAWHYWWIVGDNADDEGLIGHNGSSDLTKRVYAMGNFSRFVRPGWTRVDVNGSKSGIYGVTAFASGDDFAIVVINNSGGDVAVNLQLFGASTATSVTPYETYDDGSSILDGIGTHGNLEPKAAIAIADGVFSATVPNGITTFVASATK